MSFVNRSRVDSGAEKKVHGKVEAHGELEPMEEIETSLATKKNFFDFNGSDQEVWQSNFTKTLRKTSEVFEAVPFIPDTSVEKIGGAFVDEERSLKPRWTSAGYYAAGESKMETDSIGPDRSMSSASSNVESLKISQLRLQIEELEIARWKAPSIQETIDRLLLGKTCSLSWYKSIKEKKELLDLAIATLDGNCIMAVILFIKKTVDQSILLNILEQYPVAARHYANFLKELKDWKELKVMYRRLNDYDSLGYFNLEECNKSGLDKEERIRLIKSCPLLFKNLHLRHEEDIQHVEEYSRLVNKQQKIEEAAGHGGDVVLRVDSVLFRPLNTTLLYCCKHHRGQEHSIASPEELRKLFNIPERQYFQMDLLALALHRDWQGIGSMLTSKGLLGFGKKKKSPIGFERVIRLLGQDRYRAPDFVLVQYLEELDDLELRYELAMEVRQFDCALETLKLLRDKDRVKEIINFIPPSKHYEFRKKIESLLSNTQIKWK